VSIISTVKSLASPSPSSSAAVLDPSIAGALLERQLDSLEPSRWKEGMHEVFVRLFKDLLGVYAEAMPVRRARVLVRCMAFVYREQTEHMCAALGFKDVEEMAQEVERLATVKVNSHMLYGIRKV
jgi:separase